jgi:peptidyl-Lys metalloendopeptidase
MRISFPAALLASALLIGNATAADGLEVRIAPAAGKAASGVLQYSLSNRSAQDLLVLAWETPLRGVEDDLFEVSRDGIAVEYVGRHYKRGLPQAEDYLTLRAGETLSVEVDLSAHYAMRDSGSYRVQFVGHFHDSFAVKALDGGDETLLPVSDEDLRSEVVSLWVDGFAPRAGSEPLGVLAIAKAGSVSFVGCSNTQANGASAGHSAAQAMAADALSYLNQGLRGTRYTTWFGAYSATVYSTLKSNFVKIDDALNNKAVSYYCDCTSSAFAYVYPTRPYEVHLCNAYWAANTTGTDSKGGTIVHEISHFDVVANTDDIAYGQTACKRLASNSKRAIKNADSHEYFAENTPRLN